MPDAFFLELSLKNRQLEKIFPAGPVGIAGNKTLQKTAEIS
jgi:hypothetical protein